MVTPRAPGLDCRTCGACCGPPYVAATYVDLTAPDLARLTACERERYVGRVRKPALKTQMTADGFVCAALRGRVGTQVTCALYARRPTACRRFEPGSRGCRAMRAYVGLSAGATEVTGRRTPPASGRRRKR